MGWIRRLLGRTTAVSHWPLSTLPRWLVAFVLTVIAVDLAAISIAASVTTVRAHDLALFGLLLACTAAAVELTRKAGEQGGVIKDVQGVWELPIAILLPPLYALIAPIVRIGLVQWRVRHAPLYRRVFSCASIGLSYGAASVTFHELSPIMNPATGGTLRRGLAWILLVTVTVLVRTILNKAMIMTAVKGSDPAARIRTEVFGRESLYNDAAEICISVLVTYGVAGNLLLAPVALPVVTLLQRSLRHAQLLNDSRADSKTGLLNAATWERESTAEIVRAVRTRTPLAVALLDIDRFKAINDTYGHLVGDEVIKEIAHTLNSLLRDYDRAGRFGGEEFSLLLPQTRAVDAFRIAERVRANIAGLSIIAPGATGGERVHVTVSIGVAALDSGSKREYAELMAAADAALYRAKAGGRDQVQMISTTRGVSAISGTSRGTDGSVNSSRTDVPSAFRRAKNSLAHDLPSGRSMRSRRSTRLEGQPQDVVRMAGLLPMVGGSGSGCQPQDVVRTAGLPPVVTGCGVRIGSSAPGCGAHGGSPSDWLAVSGSGCQPQDVVRIAGLPPVVTGCGVRTGSSAPGCGAHSGSPFDWLPGSREKVSPRMWCA
jgi:diguanylate cyclase (GGDEF)-like protein